MVFIFRSAGVAPRPAEAQASAHPDLSVPALLQRLQSDGIPINASMRAELSGLARETSPALLGEALFALARRGEAEGNLPLAGAVYTWLVENSGSGGFTSGYARSARSRIEVLRGGGNFGERGENFLRHFAREATDPGLLIGMACAGGVFRLTRAWTLGELAAAGTFSPTTTRLLAHAAGFALEAPAFVAASRGVHAALEVSGRTGHPSVGHELLSAYLFIGAMKLSGAAAGGLHRRWIGAEPALSPTGRVSALLFPQMGMLGGILLAHGLEQAAGLRPAQAPEAWLAESLATLLHFHVSGRLLHGLGGPGLRGWERAMDLHAEGLLRRPLRIPTRLAFAQALEGPMLSQALNPGEEGFGQPRQLEGRGQSLRVEAADPLDIRVPEEASIPELLRHFMRLWRDNPGAQPRIALPEDLARRVADWGYAWQEAMSQNYAADFARLRRLHESLAQGESLPAEEALYLDGLMAQTQSHAQAFEAYRRLLSKIVIQARRAPDYERRPEDNTLDRVLHDLSHRPQFFQIMGLAAADLREGTPLDAFYLQQLDPRNGFSVGQTVKEGLVMAASESQELVSRVGKGLKLEGLDDIHLAQGGQAARALGDILANFLTNTWRYRRSDAVDAQIQVTRLAGGGLQFSVRDDGIGIEAQNLASLGSHGFRESRVDLSRSHGFGLSSVIENLRRMGWGPLWVKSRAGEGSEFRFEIPGEQLLSGGEGLSGRRAGPVDRMGQGGPTRLETNLDEGFMVPAAGLDLAIRRLIQEVPPGPSLPEDLGVSRAQALQSGALRLRRLEIFHRLLAAGQPLERLAVLENGSGPLLDTAFTVLRLGSRLRIKEPDGIMMRSHARWLGRILTEAEGERIQYHAPEAIDLPSPSDIVYWGHPNPRDMIRPGGVSMGEYLGRDVRPGGFLVLQSDHYYGAFKELRNLDLDPRVWERLFAEDLPDVDSGSNAIVPSAQSTNLHLQVFRRRH
ncbi:sensor histidine kinase [Deltaproteobacteria bacterium PRO3]|nr:sensor histidine kinase [Deltaproteobacteria bacterium PRO3]